MFITKFNMQNLIFLFLALIFILVAILIMILASLEKKRIKDEMAKDVNSSVSNREYIVDEINKKIGEQGEKFKEDINETSDKIKALQEVGVSGGVVALRDGIEKNSTDIKDLNKGAKASEDGKSRFSNLTRLDNFFKYEFEAPVFNDEISLKEYCEAFRDFSAYHLHLYYDIKDIRRFIASLSVTKLILLQGMSGTGKTSLALAFGRFLDNTTTVIPIQPMWKERTDLIGYYNEFTKEFNETDLLNKMYEANYNDQIYITVLDEMNIARVEYYFAEFLSLLELPNPLERNLTIVSSRWANDPVKIDKEGKLRLPLNMWFIGTANNDDSTFAISDKVYDRAMVINLDTKAEVFEGRDIAPIKVSSTYYYKKAHEAQNTYALTDRNRRRIKMLDEYLVEKFHITFGNRILKQIYTYVSVIVACGGSELDGLDDILSRKVLRKLESKNPVYVKSQAEALINKIDEIFGYDKMPLCKEMILNIEQNA